MARIYSLRHLKPATLQQRSLRPAVISDASYFSAIVFETSYPMLEASEARFSIPVASESSYSTADAYEVTYSTAYVSEARDATDVSDWPLRSATLRNRILSQLLYNSGLLEQSLQQWALEQLLCSSAPRGWPLRPATR